MQINLNKVFHFLSIKKKLVIAFVALSIAPLVIIGSYSVYSNVKTMREIALENLRHDVAIVKEKSAEFLSDVEKDIHFLGNLSPEIYSQNDIPHLLILFAKNREIYYQIRFINSSGDELYRVESDLSGNYTMAPREKLRQARESYYFILTEKLNPEQITFAPAEIVTDHKELIPVITCAMRVYKKPHLLEGIIIANIFANEFFKVVEEKHHILLGGKTVLVSGNGFYLYHPEKKRNWNKLVASQSSENLYNDYASQVTSKITSGREGTIIMGYNEIIAYAPLFDPSNLNYLSDSYFIYESISQKVIFSPIITFATMSLGILLVFLLIAISFGLLATQQLVRPIDKLRGGVEIISKGNYAYRLHIETNDEIEILAKQFNRMADSLEQRDKEISEYRSKLEQMVEDRTSELNSKKNELQTILDKVPGAFVMLDNNFRVRFASLALKNITGYLPEEVKGKYCYEIFGKSDLCEICSSRKSLSSGKTESMIEVRKNSSGEDQYFEYISIPVRERGEITSILEVITDITERKRLEEHLILSEKLAATGEMAAIIAHEIRNSLTSIKMILQLESESEHLSNADKRSMEVAINSIYHMEMIVNELLRFARPSPMQFAQGEINSILEDSIAFARPQLEKKNIKVITNFSFQSSKMKVDENYLKEAFINLIINACQALDQDGQIRIETTKLKLSKTLRDFAVHEKAMNHEDEIILPKGKEVASITIQDMGHGIAQENLNRIFDPFFSTKIGGTGLGLAMVKRTVNAHKGIITAESSPHQGTRFFIYLPI